MPEMISGRDLHLCFESKEMFAAFMDRVARTLRGYLNEALDVIALERMRAEVDAELGWQFLQGAMRRRLRSRVSTPEPYRVCVDFETLKGVEN